MLINVDGVLKSMDGKALQDVVNGEARDALIKDVLVNAILSPVQNESGMDKVKKYELAKRIYVGGDINLTAEEIALIKDRVGESYAPIIVGQLYELLEADGGTN